MGGHAHVEELPSWVMPLMSLVLRCPSEYGQRRSSFPTQFHRVLSSMRLSLSFYLQAQRHMSISHDRSIVQVAEIIETGLR
eukprot:1487919-Amphidinium_carterae.1